MPDSSCASFSHCCTVDDGRVTKTALDVPLASVASDLVSRYAVLDDGMQHLQELLFEAALDGAASDLASPMFRSPFNVSDRELLREGGAVAPLVVQLLEGVLAFDDVEVRLFGCAGFLLLCILSLPLALDMRLLD